MNEPRDVHTQAMYFMFWESGAYNIYSAVRPTPLQKTKSTTPSARAITKNKVVKGKGNGVSQASTQRCALHV